MKRLVIIALFSMFSLGLSAQHELGLSIGSSHLLGDFGGGPGKGTIFVKDIDLQSSRLAAGLFYRYNFAKFLALRGEFTYAALSSDDAFSANEARYDRGLRSNSSLLDLSALMEFNFIPLKACCGKFRFTPYVASGIALSRINPSVEANSSEGISDDELQYISDGGKQLALNLPIVFGLKFKTKKRLIVGLEASYRMAFTDELDNYVRQQNDQFFLLTAKLSYVFCKNGGSGKISREMKCPTY
ncbi:MAG: DUF6089 family protein [Chitinophagales bacterium]